MRHLLLALVLAGTTSVACAQTAAGAPQTPPLPPARGVPVDPAPEAAKVALDTCKSLDQKVGVSVLDSSGEVRRRLY